MQHRSLVLCLALIALALSSVTGCAVITQDQVAVKRTLGSLDDDVLEPGFYMYNPFVTSVLRLPTRTQNLKIDMALPSKEGVSVDSEISILYRINGKKAHKVLRDAGEDYENAIILSIFRSAAADVCAKFMAKDMHSGERSEIERAIQERMMELIDGRGFVIDAVLLKRIRLPDRLARSIEARLESEQEAMRMNFILERERQEAERKILKATGERDAQKILAEGLTEEVLRLRTIEAWLQLATSPNAKVIITSPDGPMLTTPAAMEASGSTR